ncbi:MAG: hypothetical protein ABIK68_10465 [bacterium]
MIACWMQFVWMASPLALAEKTGSYLPRTVLALYYGELNDKPQQSRIHAFAEMPLNHLGIKLRYHNINKGLPTPEDQDDLIGILSWYDSGIQLQDPLEYLKWAEAAVRSGKKFVMVGDPGFRIGRDGKMVSAVHINRFFRLLGIRDMDEWVNYTYDLEYRVKNQKVVEFERQYKGFNAPFHRLMPAGKSVKSHLVVRKAGQPETESHVVMTFPAGGYVADGYAVFTKNAEPKDIRQWYINPFEFFRLAFETDSLPKPDASTLAGRRIYYSHIDGDGWLNRTLIEEYRPQKMLSSEVILKEILLAYPDLPVTVTAVVAEIDPEWSGSKASMTIARKIFALPQVEIGSHTYSHPFNWDFFADGNAEKEADYLPKYPNGGWGENQFKNRFLAAIAKVEEQDFSYHEGADPGKYAIPRAYAHLRFDLDLEITGAAAFLDGLAPAGKKTKILMWTGNTTPFEEAIKRSHLAGLTNINGGDSRFDREYPSYSWVSPIGRRVGRELQIYASSSNENTYTDLWSGRFHGFRYLKDTLDNTEHPIRIKPFNIYYHVFSGERRASLNAVISNLDYALTREIIPIRTSRYSAIAEGFYSARFRQTGSGKWQIENRGKLQTIRFDEAAQLAVDFKASTGVIGQRYYQGSLYVYLDESVVTPELVLMQSKDVSAGTRRSAPFLIQSRWRIWQVAAEGNRFSFQTEGFGQAEMIWQVPRPGTYHVAISDGDGKQQKKEIVVGNDRQLSINPDNLRSGSASMIVSYTGK